MRRSIVVTLAACGLLAALAVRGRTARPSLDLGSARAIDLTYAFDDKTTYWPNAPSNFKLTVLHRGKTDAGYFYTANSFCTPEHGGTHLDAPIHFAEKGRAMDQIPLAQLIAPGVVIDVQAKTAITGTRKVLPVGSRPRNSPVFVPNRSNSVMTVSSSAK